MRARTTAALSTLILSASLVTSLTGPAAAAPAGAPVADATNVPAASREYVARVAVTGGDGVEQFRIHLVEPADITAAFQSLIGQSNAFPNGLVVRSGPEYNVGYSWHIDPADVEFVDLSMELCDGLPSDVEKGVITSDRYCPWSGRVVAMTRIR